MAKFSNVFKEASKRMKDFKARGFIPEGSKYVFQDFVQEVAAENRGETYQGAYTKDAYERAYGINLDYYGNTTYSDVQENRLNGLVDIYKEELKEIYETNDFYEMAELYGDGRSGNFSPASIDAMESLDDLIDNANVAMNAEPWLFRNKYGRKRSDESDMMETYHNGFIAEVGHLIDEMSEQKMKYKY